MAPFSDYPSLPPGFRFGVSTAAYQIEGASAEDGRGLSIWDTFAHSPGRIADGTTGDVAADHYHRHPEDIALMRDLGVTDYRFSIAWPRIQPSGSGAPNPLGLDFYDRLVDHLLDSGIAPMATLYHWDLPQSLEYDGGWLNRVTVERFAEYAAIVGDRLADRVAHWVPVNEPVIHMMMGYATGVHAPGRELFFDALPAGHHLLLAHGCAATALREAGATSIGCANNHTPMWPASDDAGDIGATKLFDAIWNGMQLEPMLLGRYPVDLEPLLEGFIHEGDLATIRHPLDFYGINYYNPHRIGIAPDDSELPFEFRELLGYPVTDMGWPVVPDALREWLIMLRARFRAALPPLMITENGAAYDMGPGADGVVDDQPRIDYLDAHLRSIETAVASGVDIRGYFLWTLQDNFEWAEGLARRFGLVHVDHGTQKRTPKRSFEWYRDLIKAQPNSIG